jgi:hypothetical protein
MKHNANASDIFSTKNVIARSAFHCKRSAMKSMTRQSSNDAKINIDAWIATSLYCSASLCNIPPRNDVCWNETTLIGFVDHLTEWSFFLCGRRCPADRMRGNLK